MIPVFYYGHRFYASGMGRWVSRDPIGEAGGRNLYVMTSNSPQSRVDPSGLSDISPVNTILPPGQMPGQPDKPAPGRNFRWPCKWIPEGPKTTDPDPGWKIAAYNPPASWLCVIWIGPITCHWQFTVSDEQKGHWRCCRTDFWSEKRKWNRRVVATEDRPGWVVYHAHGHYCSIKCKLPKGKCPP